MTDAGFEKLEQELRDIWVEYGHSSPIKGRHTEIVIEPQVLVGQKINNEVADILVQLYLSRLGPQNVKNGEVTIKENVMTINSKEGKPLVEIRSKRTIREFISRMR
jgi:hypothetical protein